MRDQTAGGVLLLFAAVVLLTLFVTGRLGWLVSAVSDFDVIRGKSKPAPPAPTTPPKAAAPFPVKAS